MRVPSEASDVTTDSSRIYKGLPDLRPITSYELNDGAPARLYLDFMIAIQQLRSDPRQYWQKQLPKLAMEQVEYVWHLMYSKTYELSRLRWHILPNGSKHFCIYADKPPSEENTEGEYLEFNMNLINSDEYDYTVTLGGFSVKRNKKNKLTTYQMPVLRFYIDPDSGFITKITIFESNNKKRDFVDMPLDLIQ